MSPLKHQGLRQFGLSHPTQPELRISAFHTTSLPVASNAAILFLQSSVNDPLLTFSAVSDQNVSEISTRIQSLSRPKHPESYRF